MKCPLTAKNRLIINKNVIQHRPRLPSEPEPNPFGLSDPTVEIDGCKGPKTEAKEERADEFIIVIRLQLVLVGLGPPTLKIALEPIKSVTKHKQTNVQKRT